VARVLWLFHQGERHAGIFLDMEKAEIENAAEREESRVLFAVANPPQGNFLPQIMEVFNRLDLGVRRAYT